MDRVPIELALPLPLPRAPLQQEQALDGHNVTTMG